MTWEAFIFSICIYLTGIYFILKYKKTEQPTTFHTAPNPDVIAIPRNYVINVIENTDNIDYRKYADVTLNISDILKTNELKTTEKLKPLKISYENTDFSEYVNINTKKV